MDALEKKKKRNEYARQYVAKNRGKLNAYERSRREQKVAQTKQYRRNLKKTIIDFYGGKCVCCGESRYEFLTIDHINGGGGKHKEGLGSGFNLWIIRNNFPSDFRILCWNCNCSLGVHGYCPHGNIIKGSGKKKELDELPLFGLGKQE